MDASPPDRGSTPPMLRRQQILELLRARDFVAVSELSELFGVSHVTTRGDLEALERRGGLRRVRGGAVKGPRPAPQPERPFAQTLGEYSAEKEAIGEAAAALVVSGEAIVLDVGTTTTAVARALAARSDLEQLVVFTNGLTIALELEDTIPRFTVVVTGGTLRPLQHSLIAPLADLVLDQVQVDTVFLGCNGVHPDFGITNINLPEAALKRCMARIARRLVVVADSSKVGSVSLTRVSAPEDVDVLITGRNADPLMLQALADRGVEVTTVG